MLATNFEGLAPALILTAEMDPLRDEGKAYGEKMITAGSHAEVICMKGMPRMYNRFFSCTPYFHSLSACFFYILLTPQLGFTLVFDYTRGKH